MSAMNTLKKFGLEQAFNYVYKDRIKIYQDHGLGR